MVSEQSMTMRQLLVESLVPLAAPPDAQVEQVHATDETIDELLHDYCDWTYAFVPRLEEEGLVPPGVAAVLHRIDDRLTHAALEGWGSLSCEEAVMDPAWDEVRVLATQALEAFAAVGVSIPPLTPQLLRRPADERDDHAARHDG